ncbi:hypothetical protein [Levilactobacillus namurensis]|uniref:Uncharacterized protein n=1 Tax=Levilactobacillus namurensis TaxID=380393 RepID=A0AAW8W452_9LACO|nr:hypothetical protein [Levilactobacillus namurensis]MDT7013325.1 hypothetical protein [Levilactobacillus namurensis]
MAISVAKKVGLGNGGDSLGEGRVVFSAVVSRETVYGGPENVEAMISIVVANNREHAKIRPF